MYRILPEVYDELADQLRGRIGGGNYFSGSVECLAGEVRVSLLATIIIRRRDDARPDGEVSLIDDAVAVWWECHTVVGAAEMLNDCDFAQIRERLKEC